MGENGDKILEVVRLFITNINENKKGVDKVQVTLEKLAEDVRDLIHGIKICAAIFGIAVFVTAVIVYVVDKNWISPRQPAPIVQTVPNMERMKKDIVEAILKELQKEKECEEEGE